MAQLDNSTGPQKSLLRRKLIAAMAEEPVILETHGGWGRMFAECYSGIEAGIVFEKDPRKAGRLALQRPTWAVYEADCVRAISDGAGAHLTVNFVDIDSYGECWPTVDAWFSPCRDGASKRPRAERLYLAVNCGLRHKLRLGGAWDTGSLAEMVLKYGNGLHDIYLQVCEEMIEIKAAQVGYTLSRFGGFYTGHLKQMTDFFAILERDQ